MQEINSPALWLKNFPKKKADDNKYSHGHALIIGANISDGSTGASKLSSYAALRSGAGLVSIACDKETAPIYASSMSSVMVKIIHNQEQLLNLAKDQRVKSILIGPGNGITSKTKTNILSILALRKNIILDADAITIFKNNPTELFSAIKSDVVLTPHEGEFKRLFELTEDRVTSAINAARISGATIILKGHNSIIASPNGDYVINKAAPATLATAGSGDVLAGLITGLMVQGVNGFWASCMACYIHAKAAEIFGAGLISEDLIDMIPEVIEELKL
jgi:hydroxyethylthiazole kinase-like uncharacterized protein yjeF